MGHTLLPAYGRDYKSKAEAIADFVADKDFIDSSFGSGGAYINRAQIADGAVVKLRYRRATMVAVVTKGKEPGRAE